MQCHWKFNCRLTKHTQAYPPIIVESGPWPSLITLFGVVGYESKLVNPECRVLVFIYIKSYSTDGIADINSPIVIDLFIDNRRYYVDDTYNWYAYVLAFVVKLGNAV